MSENNLKKKIENLRKKLVETGKKENIFTDEKVLEKSRKLDCLINEYYKNHRKY
ncbi:MAG: aspartyl-phosphate phosphatase Spo0E family protein [bacterium]